MPSENYGRITHEKTKPLETNDLFHSSLSLSPSRATHSCTAEHQEEEWSCALVGGECVEKATKCSENLAESSDCPDGWCCFACKWSGWSLTPLRAERGKS